MGEQGYSQRGREENYQIDVADVASAEGVVRLALAHPISVHEIGDAENETACSVGHATSQSFALLIVALYIATAHVSTVSTNH